MRVAEVLQIKGNILFTVGPDTPMRQAVRTMAEEDIGSLVVIHEGEICGLLSFREVLHLLSEQEKLTDEPVSRYMYTQPLLVTPDMEINALRRLMLERHSRYVPVISQSRELMGVLSFYDVAKAILEDQGFENDMLRAYISGSDQEPAAAERSS